MSTQKYDRFKSAPWFQLGVRPAVLIGGAGGIGSWLTILLNRAGFETHVFDFDTLEAVNMAGQCFMHKDIGKPKVEALASVVRKICRDEIIPYNEKVTAETMSNDIVFTAFDNIEARNLMFQAWKAQYTGNEGAIFIDGRLTAEQLTILCVRGNDPKAIERYEKEFIFPDSEVEEVDCTMKQTSHGAAMIASHMVSFFTNWFSGVLGRDTSRSAPFFWEYFIPIDFNSSHEADLVEIPAEEPALTGADLDIAEVRDNSPFRWDNPEAKNLPVITKLVESLTTEEAIEDDFEKDMAKWEKNDQVEASSTSSLELEEPAKQKELSEGEKLFNEVINEWDGPITDPHDDHINEISSPEPNKDENLPL